MKRLVFALILLVFAGCSAPRQVYTACRIAYDVLGLILQSQNETPIDDMTQRLRR